MLSRQSEFAEYPRAWYSRQFATQASESVYVRSVARRVFSMAEAEVNLSKTYDAIVIGSGAAGGMAAHVLTSHGLQVLLLEAGKKLPIEKELRSVELAFDQADPG